MIGPVAWVLRMRSTYHDCKIVKSFSIDPAI